MSDPARPARPTLDLRALTPARVALGRNGASLPTKPLLDFTLDHARARDAVHAVFDADRMTAALGVFGLPVVAARSRAVARHDYLRRPDLGRQLDPAAAAHLGAVAARAGPLAIVVGDGLSPTAVHAHARGLLQHLLPRLSDEPAVAVDRIVVASGARVALGDEIGAILGASMVLMLIGERPGLSAPDSLGAYITFAPKPGRTDAERNCVSNIHKAGLSYDEAAHTVAWLIREGLAGEATGVALKDESGDRAPRRIGTTSPG